MVRGLLTLALVSFFSIGSTARAATIAVDTTAEELPAVVNGNCSLREAIVAANGDVAVDACPAGSGADEIVLATGVTYRFTAAELGRTALPIVTSELVVRGTNTTLLRSGAALLRFFEIAGGGALTLRDLDLMDASVGDEDGGAVLARGALTIVRCEINGNAARRGGAVFAEGALDIVESRFVADVASESGGALYVMGTLDVSTTNFEDCALEEGTSCSGCARDGGAVAALGAVTIEASTFLRDVASAATGSLRPRGGALFAARSASLVNVVFVDDGALGADAEGSAIAALETLALTHCTFAGSPRITTADGGATLHVAGDVEVIGTAVSHAGARALVPLCAAPLTGTVVGSYFDDASCDGTDDGGAAVDRRGVPVAGSPLIDAAPSAMCPARDRDGASRPAGLGCDIGAFEVGAAEPGVAIVASPDLTTDEGGGTTSFTARLQVAPTAVVTFPVHSDDATEVSFEPATLVFDPTNWSMPQTVTLSGVDDDVDDGDGTARIGLLPATSDDPEYSGLFSLGVTVTNLDDDTSSIEARVEGAAGEDGASATLYVRLGTQPIDAVSLAVVSDDDTEGTVSASLVFTDADWDVEQALSVVGVDDGELDGDVDFGVTLDPVASTDDVYAALAARTVTVTNVDDERSDAGGGTDAGVSVDVGAPDAGASVVDAGGLPAGTAGCGCRAGRASAGLSPLGLFALVLLLRSRRRARR